MIIIMNWLNIYLRNVLDNFMLKKIENKSMIIWSNLSKIIRKLSKICKSNVFYYF